MDYELKELIRGREVFRQTHRKILIPERKTLIKQQYELLMLEFAGNADFTLKETADSIDMTISADSFLSCEDEGYPLTFLIGISNFTIIDTIDGKIVLSLWFRCWEWINKD